MYLIGMGFLTFEFPIVSLGLNLSGQNLRHYKCLPREANRPSH